MSKRARPGEIEFAAPQKFWNTLTYHTPDSREMVEEPGYFLSVQHMLQAGDEIRVCCGNDDGSWYKAIFEVCVANVSQVVVERLGDWRLGGAQGMRGLKAVYTPSDGFGKWRVVDAKGYIVAKGLGKAEAFALSGEKPKEEIKTAAKKQETEAEVAAA